MLLIYRRLNMTFISNSSYSAANMLSAACYTAAAALAFRHVGMAGVCKVRSIVSGRFGKENEAQEWNKSSHEYWTAAKKDAVRDLTAIAGLLLIGITSNCGCQKDSIKGNPARQNKEDNIKDLHIEDHTDWISNKSLESVIGFFGGIGFTSVFFGYPMLYIHINRMHRHIDNLIK